MKVRPYTEATNLKARQTGEIAFTLNELMIAMAIFLLVIAGVVSSHMFGLRMLQLAQTKLGSSEGARKAFDQIVSDVGSAKTVRIGAGTFTSFTEIGVNTQQQGSAIQINSSTNTNFFIRYYLDATDKRLKRMTNNATTNTIVASAISNQVLFAYENFAGTVLTNRQNNSVLAVTLRFYQLDYPTVPVGPGNYYDSYMIQTRIARRGSD